MWRRIFSINYLTFIINFRYFKFKDAIKLPILIFGKVSVHALKGKIVFESLPRPGLIKIGFSKLGIFDKGIRTVFNIHGTIYFEGTANIGRGSSISVSKNSILRLGNNFTITGKSSIICRGGKNISFGKNNLLSWDILIMNHDFPEIIDQTTNEILNAPKDIVIGDNVWIGCNTKILKGSIIPPNCVIGANSMVTKILEEPNSLYVGNPIKRIRGNLNWKQ